MTPKNKEDGHRAKRAGRESEKRLTIACENMGYKRHHLIKDFKIRGGNLNHSYYGTVKFDKPEKFFLAEKKSDNYFQSDGLIVNPANDKGAIIESKNSDKRGTTEEKCFYDLYKIEEGIYGSEYPLVYLFQGSVCEKVNEYALFAAEAEKRKLPVHVIFDPTPDLRTFQSFMKKLLG